MGRRPRARGQAGAEGWGGDVGRAGAGGAWSAIPGSESIQRSQLSLSSRPSGDAPWETSMRKGSSLSSAATLPLRGRRNRRLGGQRWATHSACE